MFFLFCNAHNKDQKLFAWPLHDLMPPLYPITLAPGLKLNNIQHNFEHRKTRKLKEGFGKKVSCYNIKFKVQLFVLGSKINR